MKIAGCIFQKRKIRSNTPDLFDADYKGHNFYITTGHGFGEPENEDLKRFNIDVVDNDAESFATVVETYEDYETIEEAIKSALEGAMLLPQQQSKIV